MMKTGIHSLPPPYPAPGWATSGASANWPKQWAQDVLPVAGSVYRQITLTTPGAQAGHWHVTVTPAFETSARELTDQQFAKAGWRRFRRRSCREHNCTSSDRAQY